MFDFGISNNNVQWFCIDTRCYACHLGPCACQCVDLLDFVVWFTLFFLPYECICVCAGMPNQFQNVMPFRSFFNTIIYSRQMAGPTGAITAKHDRKGNRTWFRMQQQKVNYTETERKRGKQKTHTPIAFVVRAMREEKSSNSGERETSSTFGVVAIVFDCCVCSMISNCWVLLLAVLFFFSAAILSGQWHVCRRHLSIRVIFDVKHAFLDSFLLFAVVVVLLCVPFRHLVFFVLLQQKETAMRTVFAHKYIPSAFHFQSQNSAHCQCQSLTIAYIRQCQ